ncbi:MAG: NAD+ synthase [Acidimicrobiales bacterium]
MSTIRVAACQINTVVGDLDGNAERVLEALRRAEEAGCDVAVFPELSLTGYPPEDLLLKPGFVAACRQTLDKVAARTGACAAVVGFVDGAQDLFNAAAVCADGAVAGVVHKRLLPNYGPFDERRYFTPGQSRQPLFDVAGASMGVSVCEDIWSPSGPISDLSSGGAEVIVNLNASPYHRGKARDREAMVATRAADASAAIVYVNLVGGQDELIFDGGSFVVDQRGELIARARSFDEQLLVAELELRPVYRKRLLDPRHRPVSDPLPHLAVSGPRPAPSVPAVNIVVAPPDPVQEVYEALTLATRDYVTKNGFTDVLIGLSGGVDSTLVATIAADALGPERVHGVAMPSRYSSDHSVQDARVLAERLGIDFRIIEIEPAHAAFESMLASSFAGRAADLTEENLQSRVRGVTLMALSNKLNWLVLTTSNKSESAVGYATLYGDTAGGFSVIKDVPKLLVYDLCRWRNAQDEVDGRVGPIPERVLTKAPSAELRPDQRDDQSLPPYEILDPILEAYVEDDRSIDEIVARGYDPAVVTRIVRLVDLAEYKRRQTAPGARISTRAFGKDRRLPITNRYRG